MFDKGGGPSGHTTDECTRPTGQTLIRQAEEVGHAIPNASHQAGRTAQDIQRSNYPTCDRGTSGECDCYNCVSILMCPVSDDYSIRINDTLIQFVLLTGFRFGQ